MKAITIFTAVALSVALAACSKSPSSEAPTKEQMKAGVEKFVPKKMEPVDFATVKREMAASASK